VPREELDAATRVGAPADAPASVEPAADDAPSDGDDGPANEPSDSEAPPAHEPSAGEDHGAAPSERVVWTSIAPSDR
jgi:hypothetical protein